MLNSQDIEKKSNLDTEKISLQNCYSGSCLKRISIYMRQTKAVEQNLKYKNHGKSMNLIGTEREMKCKNKVEKRRSQYTYNWVH